MRVFHFCSKEHALANIKNSQIKIAMISELNDPFEFYVNFKESGNSLDDEAIETLKNHYNKILGLVCFSEKMSSPVQWAHYADNHRGICLEFEVPKTLLVKVKYRNKPASIDINDGDWKPQFVKATITKYIHWGYEKERRLIIPLDSKKIVKGDNHYFMPFSDTLSPIRAHTGLRCKLTEAEHSALQLQGIDVLTTLKSRAKYKIENA